MFVVSQTTWPTASKPNNVSIQTHWAQFWGHLFTSIVANLTIANNKNASSRLFHISHMMNSNMEVLKCPFLSQNALHLISVGGFIVAPMMAKPF